MEEVFKDVPGFEGMYQISNLGRLKSFKWGKEKILKKNIDKHNYCFVILYKNLQKKTIRVHKLVAMAFLNHTPCGHKLVIDHINNNSLDNRVENLQLISTRENLSKDKKNKTSKYTGVSWDKVKNKWNSKIRIDGKLKHLGYFEKELEAKEYYDNALKSFYNNEEIKTKKRKKISKYIGVSFDKNTNKWFSQIIINGKNFWIGRFKTEIEASQAYINKLKTLQNG